MIDPSFDTFVRLATMFNISVDQFFHREGQPDDSSRHIWYTVRKQQRESKDP